MTSRLPLWRTSKNKENRNGISVTASNARRTSAPMDTDRSGRATMKSCSRSGSRTPLHG